MTDATVTEPTADAPDQKPTRFYHRAAFLLLTALLILRLVTATRYGLAWDEAYYWQWSRHLALCYYDAGPGIALSIRAGTAILGDTPLGVRLVPILMGVAADALVYAAACRWWSPRVAFGTLVLAGVAPLLAIGSVLATYDLPQIFFWAAGLYCVTRAVGAGSDGTTLAEAPGPSATSAGAMAKTANIPLPVWWYLTGICVGLGTLTKPTMIFFAPGVLLLLALVPTYRKQLASPHPYLAFGLALLCLAPVFIWNAGHDNVNWIHTINRGNRDTGAAPGRWLGDFWGGQAIVVGPFLLLFELYALYRALRRPTEARNAFLIAFTVPVLAVCTIIAVRSKVEVNWPVAAHLTGLLAIAAMWPGRQRGNGWLVAATVVSGLLSLVLFFPNALVIRPFGPFVENGTWEKVNEQYGWEPIARAVVRERDALRAEDPRVPVFVAGTGYRVSSILAFYLQGSPPVEKIQMPDTRHDQYNLWTNEAALAGKNAVVAIDGERSEQAAFLQTRFASVSKPVIVNVTRPGFRGPVKVWYLYRCRGLK